jgi:hypothetical protein
MADDEMTAPDPGERVLRRICKSLDVLASAALILYGVILLPTVAALLSPQASPSAAQYEHAQWSLFTVVGVVVTVEGLLYFVWPTGVPNGIWPSHWPRLASTVLIWFGAVFTWYAAAALLGAAPPLWIFVIVGGGPLLTLRLVEAVLRRRERRNAAREEARGG